MAKIKILHITPHLGGGVGKALSGLAEESKNSEFEHIFICLDNPKRQEFVNKIHRRANQIIICPSYKELEELIIKSDIVQLEYWNDNTILDNYLKNIKVPISRFIVWYHNNGLYGNMPIQLILSSDIFLFTSECSWESEQIKKLINENKSIKDKLGVVYSCGNFSELPDAYVRKHSQDLNDTFKSDDIHAGFFGNLRKLHHNFIDYINVAGLDIKIVGDIDNNTSIIEKYGIRSTGYVANIADELCSLNILIYLLDPKHFGTTENALLEAMYMGIVPIVLNNSPEKYIVQDKKTGFIVRSIEEFKDVVQWLRDNPLERKNIGIDAYKYIQDRFSAKNTNKNLNSYYYRLLNDNYKN